MSFGRFLARSCRAAALAALLLAPGGAGAAQPGESNHDGYYYPKLTSSEIFRARAQPMKKATREARVGFVTGITQSQLARPYAPNYVLFAKGDEAQKLILISLGESGFRNLYQARALLAQMTAVARGSPLLRDLAVEDIFTFLDLARMLGFEQITLSDGAHFAHQVTLK